jgi:type IV secretory pathway TrbD component
MLRKIPIHKSLYKPLLFVGCERLPFTVIVTIGGVMLMAFVNLYSVIAILLFYLVSILLVRRVNESDCQFFKCIYRYVAQYQDYYPANANYPGRVDKPQSEFY